ncbi:MAG: histidinol dehydrogenase [marine benthic group bacterium]|nr:histidinol dehydrogenase [Gemmatimonadota bacterium]
MSGASGGPIPVLTGESAQAWVKAGGRTDDDRLIRGSVQEIIERVRNEGDAALLDLAERYESGRPDSLLVPRAACDAALARLPEERRTALDVAARNIRRFHEGQVGDEPAVQIMPGVTAWREFRPMDRIGVYAPGGRAAYPSSVLMSAIPARLAGVREIALCCPAGPDGLPPESVMAACALLEVDELFAVGGAQAIAAMALGTETIRQVDKIFGPGSAWVNEAKLALFAEVEIDLPAGPSEVVVWADSSADPRLVAAELVAQCEHGPDSISACVFSDSVERAEELNALQAHATVEEVRLALEELDAGQGADAGADAPGAAARESLARSAILCAESDSVGAAWVNELAGEHLVVLRREPRRDLATIRHAGSVFLGPWTPVAAGDYASGTNHVLPTRRRARACSGLGVADFGRWLQVQQLSREGLEELGPTIETLALWEGLPAHAASIRARFPDSRPVTS